MFVQHLVDVAGALFPDAVEAMARIRAFNLAQRISSVSGLNCAPVDESKTWGC